jgi:hypothetical protein
MYLVDTLGAELAQVIVALGVFDTLFLLVGCYPVLVVYVADVDHYSKILYLHGMILSFFFLFFFFL